MSDVGAGAVLTLVIPLSLLMVILAIWAVRFWRGREAPDELPRSSDGA